MLLDHDPHKKWSYFSGSAQNGSHMNDLLMNEQQLASMIRAERRKARGRGERPRMQDEL
jgi:hypothetical protein